MPDITVEELELLTFFAVEPTPRDPDAPWPYNDFLYEVDQLSTKLSFAVDPVNRDVRLILRNDSRILYELNAMSVSDVKYHNDKGRETLQIVLTSRDSLWLRITPEITISHNLSEDARE